MDVTVREKNIRRAPVIIAPNRLVAAKGIARSITDTKIVPRMPATSGVIAGHTQVRLLLFRIIAAVMGRIARYTTAMPKSTHKNAGVTVITAIKRSIAVIIPITMSMSSNESGFSGVLLSLLMR